MRLLELRLPAYRGLRDFHLDLTTAVDHGHAIATLIGPNGGGKSRILHALVEIFGALYQPKGGAAFAFEISYAIGDDTVQVRQEPAESSPTVTVSAVGDKAESVPRSEWTDYLPDHVFGYQAHLQAPWTAEFERHRLLAARCLTGWQREWRAGFNEWLITHSLEDSWTEELTVPISCSLYTRVFLCTPSHLALLLLAQISDWSDAFGTYLHRHSGIEGVASAVLRVKAPRSVRRNWYELPYWGLGGPVRTFFAAVAESGRFGLVPEADPLTGVGSPVDGFGIELGGAEDIMALRNLFDRDLSMFALLTTLLDAGYLTVDVKLESVDGTTLSLNDLSSGEQQRLTILGLLRLQRAEQSLFLLDEPDSHFHPEWSRLWYSSVLAVLGEDRDSQFIAATHEPLLVANMTREQVRVVAFVEGRAAAMVPTATPRGQGAGGLLTTDLFGLPSQLDEYTQALIDRQYDLLAEAEDDAGKQVELGQVTAALDSLGFSTANRDPLVSAFLAELHRRRRALIASAESTDPPSPQELAALVSQLFDERLSSAV
ncbi:putative ATPase [Catenulispora sp. GP43]|uniref:AAA family ATPase n=1 Tax=Catenulispora sp. GP43 TaxID=3156263 RepID=UPI0035171379